MCELLAPKGKKKSSGTFLQRPFLFWMMFQWVLNYLNFLQCKLFCSLMIMQHIFSSRRSYMQWKNFSQFCGVQKLEKLLGYNWRYGFCPKEITFLMNAILFPYLSVKLRQCTSFRNIPELLLIWWMYFNYADFRCYWHSAKLFVTSVNFYFYCCCFHK